MWEKYNSMAWCKKCIRNNRDYLNNMFGRGNIQIGEICYCKEKKKEKKLKRKLEKSQR